MKEFSRKVDIIIPVYNAYDELNICVDSVRKHTDLTKHRLILVNDNSPDERIFEYLEKQKGDNVVVVHNTVNKGFSAGVNLGMKMSEVNDVILLNSDTVVTKGWVEKLISAAYSDPRTGTVTPLSNNATLCSVPNMFEENTLPEGISVDEMAAMVERVSLRKYPRITVANGFCMFIKREVIECVGYFDEDTFKRGYGEENDFCNRAGQMGYCHVMCDDTYIYHSGTKSFIDAEKFKLITEHEKILKDRYPNQFRANEIYVRDNPNSDVGLNIKLHYALMNGRRNILFALQSDFREDAEDNVGGTQFHVKQLKNSLCDRCNIFVAAVNMNMLNLTLYIDEEIFSFAYPIYRSAAFFSFRDSRLEELWHSILSGFKIDTVHIHHSLKLSLDLFYVAKELGIPLYGTLHDYFYICPSEKLLDENNESCIGKNPEIDKCKKCLLCMRGITDKVDYLTKWRAECASALALCDELFVPSSTAKEIYAQYYPEIRDRITVREHGYSNYTEVIAEAVCSKEVTFNVEKEIIKNNGVYLIGWINTTAECVDNPRLYVEILSDNGQSRLIPMASIFRPDVTEQFNAGFKIFIPYLGLDNSQVYFVIKDDDKYLRSENAYTLKTINKDKITDKATTTNNDKTSNKAKTTNKDKTSNNAINKDKKLNIAFIGGINDAKGGSLIAEIVKRANDDINWFVMGNIGSEKLDMLDRKNLVKTGGYESEQLGKLLEFYEIDIIGILSIWPETFSYTLTESLLNKIPVIVTETGALKERVLGSDYGWTVSVEHCVDEFLGVVSTIISNKVLLEEKKEALKHYRSLTEKEMAEMYFDTYSKKHCTLTTENKHSCDYRRLFGGYYDKAITGVGDDLELSVSKAEYNRIILENNRIKQSVAYRFSRKLISANIPGKYLVYKFIKKRME